MTGLTGTAAGVPYLALPPATPRPSAPVVIAWHLLDPPRTPAAFAAAVPLDGLDAWRIYLGLPMTGDRMVEGGNDELMRLAFADGVLNLHGPISSQANAEFEPALAELRSQLDLGHGPVGLLGASLGGGTAGLVLSETEQPIEAAVLINPLIDLRAGIDAIAASFGMAYPWSEASHAVADRLDLAAHAPDLAKRGEPAVLLVIGEQDLVDGFREPAYRVRQALADCYGDPSRTDVQLVAGMSHALAEEPGTEPAPQTAHAARVDALATAWFERFLLPPGGEAASSRPARSRTSKSPAPVSAGSTAMPAWTTTRPSGSGS
jgi:dienelactone hydrolase